MCQSYTIAPPPAVYLLWLVERVEKDEEVVREVVGESEGNGPLSLLPLSLSRCHSAISGRLVSQISSDMPAEQGLLIRVSMIPVVRSFGATGALPLVHCGEPRHVPIAAHQGRFELRLDRQLAVCVGRSCPKRFSIGCALRLSRRASPGGVGRGDVIAHVARRFSGRSVGSSGQAMGGAFAASSVGTGGMRERRGAEGIVENGVSNTQRASVANYWCGRLLVASGG